MIACTVCGRISEGVPPPKKIERTARPGRQRGAMGDLGREGGDESLLVDRLGAHVRIEIAIGAFGEAERPMHVDAEAGSASAPARPPARREFRSRHRRVMPVRRAPRATARTALCAEIRAMTAQSTRRHFPGATTRATAAGSPPKPTRCSRSSSRIRSIPPAAFATLDDAGRALAGERARPLHATTRMVHCFAIAHLLGRPGAADFVDHGMTRDLRAPSRRHARRLFLVVRRRRPARARQARLRPRLRAARRLERQMRRPS